MQIIESGVNPCGKWQAALLLSLSMVCSRHTVRLQKYAKQVLNCSICQAALSVTPFATVHVQCHVQLCLLSSDIVLVLVQQAEAHAQLGEMMQQLAFICCFASLPPSAAEELPRSLMPAAELVAEMPQAQKQGLTELVHLIDTHLTKRVVGPTTQPGNPTAEEPGITRPVSSDLSSTLDAWKARQLAKGPTVPFKACHLPAADKPASAFSQAQAGGPQSTDAAEATRNLLKETLLSGQQEAPRHGDNSSNRGKSTRERLREKLNAMTAAGEGVQAAEPSAQPMSMPADQGSTFLAQLAASAVAAAPSQALGLASGPGAAHVLADMSDVPEAKPAKKMGKNQRRKAAAEASKAQQPTAAAGNADSAADQPEAATSSSSEGTASGPGSPAQVSPRPVEADSKAATSSQDSRPAQPSSTSQAEAASAPSSAQDIAGAGHELAAQSDLAPVSSEAVAGGQQPESADASSKAATREVDSDNSAQASTKAAVSISKADPVQAVSNAAVAAQAASKATIGNRKADTPSASSRAAAEAAAPKSPQTGSPSLAGTGTAVTAHASNAADTSMPEAAAAQADSNPDAGKTEPTAAQAGNTAAATQAGDGSAATVAQPSSGDRAVNGAHKEGTANKNRLLSQSDKAAGKDTPAQLAQKADQPASSAAAVPPTGIAAHRPRVPKAVLRATAAPYTPLNPSAAVSKAKGIAMGELATPFASACRSCIHQHTFLSSCLCCCCLAMSCLPVHGLAVSVRLVMSSTIAADI